MPAAKIGDYDMNNDKGNSDTSAVTLNARNARKEQSRPGDAAGGGKKLDVGKAPVAQGFIKYFPNAIFAVSMVSEYGHRKYEIDHATGEDKGYSGNCRRVPDGYNRYGDAKARHVVKTEIEGPYDIQDSGLLHKAQEAWNILMELERGIVDGTLIVMRGNDLDKDGNPILGTARPVKP